MYYPQLRQGMVDRQAADRPKTFGRRKEKEERIRPLVDSHIY
jgi:hypothetical protein